MMDAVEDFVKTSGDAMQIPEGQITTVQLTVGEYLIDQVLHKPLDARRGRIIQCTRGRLHHIGQHHQVHLFGLGFGAGVAEVLYLNGIIAFKLFGFFKEVVNQTAAVVLLYSVDDNLPQLVFLRMK